MVGTFIIQLFEHIACDWLAGVVYLKNMVYQYWTSLNNNEDATEFVVSENDKQMIRDNLVEAIIASANIVRSLSPFVSLFLSSFFIFCFAETRLNLHFCVFWCFIR